MQDVQDVHLVKWNIYLWELSTTYSVTCGKVTIFIDLGKGQIAVCLDTGNTTVHTVQFLIFIHTLQNLIALLHAFSSIPDKKYKSD